MRSKAVPAANPPAPDPVAPPVYRSEGQRLFCALTTQASAIARELGVIKQVVSNWRMGENSPSAAQRTRIAELFAVPVAAWERIPSDAMPPVTEDAPAPRPKQSDLGTTDPGDGPIGPEPSVMEDCLVQLAWLRKQMQRPEILARERLALNDAFRKALRDKARYELDAEMSENRMVRNHPAWRRFKGRLLEVLRRHPAAARDVTELITELLGDEERNK